MTTHSLLHINQPLHETMQSSTFKTLFLFGFLFCFCSPREGRWNPPLSCGPDKTTPHLFIVIVCHLLQVILPLIQIFGGTLALAVYSLITGWD